MRFQTGSTSTTLNIETQNKIVLVKVFEKLVNNPRKIVTYP